MDEDEMICPECGAEKKIMTMEKWGGPIIVTCENGHEVPLEKYDWFQNMLEIVYYKDKK